MKILWYIPRLNIGGAESFTISLLNELAISNSVILLTDTRKSSLILDINPNITIINLNDDNKPCYLTKIIRLRAIIKKYTDYVLISNLTHANINCYISLIFTKIKFIAIEHNTLSKYLSHNKCFKNLLINILCKLLYKRLHKIICVSDYVRTDLINNYKCNNCHTILNGIDVKNIHNKSNAFDFKHELPYIIFVGRIVKQKNIPRLINIFNKLVLDGVKHNLIIIGDGPDLNFVKSYAINLNLSNRIYFLGEKSNPYPYIKNADLSIMTSHFEGFGIFLLESLSLGVKVFTYDNKIINEITNCSELVEKFTATDSELINIDKIKLLLNTNIDKLYLQKITLKYDTKFISEKYIQYISN